MNTATYSLVKESMDLKRTLDERLEVHDDSRRAAQEKLHEICEGLRKQIDELENKINSELEDNFNKEDSRLQSALSNLRDVDMDKHNDNNINKLRQAIQKAKAELLMIQSYDIIQCEYKRQENYIAGSYYNNAEDFDDDEMPGNGGEDNFDDDEGSEDEEEDDDNEESNMKKRKIESKAEFVFDLTKMWELKVDKKLISEILYLRKPKDIHINNVTNGKISIQLTHLNADEKRVLSKNNLMYLFKYKCLLSKKGSNANDEQNSKEYTLNETDDCFTFVPDFLEVEATYEIKVKAIIEGKESEWSDEPVEFTAPEFRECCAWKKCSDYVYNKYSTNDNNPRIASKVGFYCLSTVVIGNVPLPPNRITSWNIRILNSRENNGGGIFIGVAPFDIKQDEDNECGCGWYLSCYDSTLRYGPHHKNYDKEYGSRKEKGKYVYTGSTVGVVVDTTKGNISFVLDGVNLGVAYDGIPLDKPLVPCVLLYRESDSVEIDTSEVKDNVDASISVPSNIITKSITWDSITLTWNSIKGISLYQIEADGKILENVPTTTTFTKRGLLGETEHSFRIRTVNDNKVSGWSDIVKGKTVKAPDFLKCAWRKCPDYVYWSKKYSVNKRNPRTAIKVDSDSYFTTIIGNSPLPSNRVSSWNIKILKTRNNDGNGIYVGVAPFDVNQNQSDIWVKCGWYLDCHTLTLHSGPPHGHEYKIYGPRKKDGQYVHTGDSVGIIMDTIKGELSFVLNGMNHGVAFEGIPLDKPLVPCVLLQCEGDSVELDLSEVKESEVVPFIPVPSNIAVQSITWDSITLTWDAVEGAEFYQIWVDGNISGDGPRTNIITKREFLPDSEHSFKVRTVIHNKVSEWSGAVKGKTVEDSFESSGWRECPVAVAFGMKYYVDKLDPRIVTKVGSDYCTAIGNTPIPLNKVTSWNIKILKPKYGKGDGIYIGVTPFDINQNENENFKKCGWHFYCFNSELCSGPPHNYEDKVYGPRKIYMGEYVHTGDIVGVVMDTTKGELSFVVKGVNLGVAYKGIPLDKPLVPCVILSNNGDSIELVI